MRGVKSLAYDLIVGLGRVRAGVALLLRRAERKPTSPDFSLGGISFEAPEPERTRLIGAWRRVGPPWKWEGRRDVQIRVLEESRAQKI